MTPNSDITNKESHHLQSEKNIQTRKQFNCCRSDDDDDDDEHDILSQNSGWNNDNDKSRRKTSSRLPKQLTACQEEDVLLGRGRVCWVGNQRFQTEVRRNAKRYADANSRYEKAYIVLEIIAKVQAWGGRFLYKPKPSAVAAEKEPFAKKEEPLPNLAIASQCKVRKKVGQALRYQIEQIKGEPSEMISSAASPQVLYETTGKIRDDLLENTGGEKDVPEQKKSLEQQEQAQESSKKEENDSSESPSPSWATCGREEDSNEELDCCDSLGSFDLSLAVTAAMDILNDSDLQWEPGSPLLSNDEMLSSRGYYFDAVQAALLSDLDSPNQPMSMAEESAPRGALVDRKDALSPTPLSWNGGCVGSQSLPITTIVDTAPNNDKNNNHINEYMGTDDNNENKTNANIQKGTGTIHSWDVSFMALMHEMKAIPRFLEAQRELK